jgi:hypothetical protein
MNKRRPQKANTRRAECHPERPHYAHGRCSACYVNWRYAHKPGWAEYRKAYEKDRQPRDWTRQIKQRYGIVPADYQRLLDLQGGGCAVCGVLPEVDRHLAVDHDHSTGTVRGLLCKCCNMAAGFLRNSPQSALALFRYLRKFHGWNSV